VRIRRLEGRLGPGPGRTPSTSSCSSWAIPSPVLSRGCNCLEMGKKQIAFTMASQATPRWPGHPPHDRRTVCRDAHSADQPISSSPSARTDAGIVSAAICSGALTAVLLPRRASPTRLQRIPQGQQVPTETRNKPLTPSSTRRLEGRLGAFTPRFSKKFEAGGCFFSWWPLTYGNAT